MWVGHAHYHHPAMLNIACIYSAQYFPYDKQTCAITHVSWMFDSSDIDVWPVRREDDLTYFKPNEEWSMEPVQFIRISELYLADSKTNFTLVKATIHMQRRARYYILTLVVPNMVISVVAVTGFFTAGSSGSERIEKTNLGMATLLAKAVLLLLIADIMPITSSYQPLIGILFLADMMVIAFSLFMTCFVIEFERNASNNARLPLCVREFWFHRVAPLLCMHVPLEIATDSSNIVTKNLSDLAAAFRKTLIYEQRGRPTEHPPMEEDAAPEEDQASRVERATLSKLHDIHRLLKEAVQEIEDRKNLALWTEERMYLGRVLDRVCVVVSLFLLTICLGFFFVVAHTAH